MPSDWLFVDIFVGKHWDTFWGNSIFILSGNDALLNYNYVPKWVKLFPIVLGIIGISIATIFYVLMPQLPSILANSLRPIYLLFLNKWYFDEIYNLVFIVSVKKLSLILSNSFDKNFIDKFGPDGISSRIISFSKISSKLHSGYVFHYSFGMFLGLTSLILIYYLDF